MRIREKSEWKSREAGIWSDKRGCNDLFVSLWLEEYAC